MRWGNAVLGFFEKRSRTLLAVTLIGLSGCEGVSRNPLGAGGSSSAGTTAASGQGGVNGGEGGVAGREGGVAGSEDGSIGGEGGEPGGEGAMTGSAGGAGGEGGATGGEGGVTAGEGGVTAGEGGIAGEGGVTAGEGGASAGAAGGSAGDGGAAGGPVLRRCSPDKPFGAPKRSGLPNGCTRLRLNPDETVGYYGCRDSRSYEVIVATRPDRTAPFGEGRVVLVDLDDSNYYSPTVTADGLVLYFENDRPLSYSRLYRSVWDPKLGAFGPIELAPELSPENAKYDDYSPYVIPSGQAIYFHSSRVYPYEEIYRASLDGDSFSEPERIILQGSRGHPVVSPDELTLYYTRNVTGGAHGADIWQVTRTTTSESFELFEPELVQGPNEGEYNELASFVSADGCRLYFDRNFPGPDTNSFVVERVPDRE